MLDFAICLWLFIIGINLKNWVSGFTKYEKKLLNALFFWHILVGIGYVGYLSFSGGGDAYAYWNHPKIFGWDYVVAYMRSGSASGYMYLLNYVPSKILQLSFFAGSMIYVLLGYAAFVYLLKIIKENIPDYLALNQIKILTVPIFPAILFLPNIHFWTSGLGKDTILFFCIVIFVYAIKDFQKRAPYILISIGLSIFIRPHILMFLFTSVGMAAVFDGRLKAYQKVFLYLVFIGVFIVLLPRVMEFTKLESLETESIDAYVDNKASALNKDRVDSGIDISNYPYPFKIFTFLFRPLFFDMQGLLGLIASFENLIFLIFTIKVLKNRPLRAFKLSGLPLKSIVMFFVLGSLTFPLILGNLGIILRQKTPFIIMFIIFGFWILSTNYQERTKKIN